jgi:phosphoglycerate-specific signal transduction histidine kinase
MGISSIEDVVEYVSSEKLRDLLVKCKNEHEELNGEIQQLLDKYHDDGKDPNPIAKGMSWMKTELKLAMCEKDSTIADLMVDGCNMGIKSLYKYMNQYPAANQKVMDLCTDLIAIEEELQRDLRDYL